MGESNTVVSVPIHCIGTYNSIALTYRYVCDDLLGIVNQGCLLFPQCFLSFHGQSLLFRPSANDVNLDQPDIWFLKNG